MNYISGDECYRKLDSDKLVFFYFTASWCGPCQNLSPKISLLYDNVKEYVDMYKIDISNDDNNELCEKCSVESIPTCILFKNRSSLGVVNGNDIDKIINLLNKNLNIKIN